MRGVGIALDLVDENGELRFLQQGDRIQFAETGADALACLSQYLVAVVAAVAGVPHVVEIEGQQRRQVPVAFFLRPGLLEAVVQQTVGGHFSRRIIHGVGLTVFTQRPFQAGGDGAGYIGADLGIVLDQANEYFLRNAKNGERGFAPHGGGARCVAEQGQLAEQFVLADHGQVLVAPVGLQDDLGRSLDDDERLIAHLSLAEESLADVEGEPFAGKGEELELRAVHAGEQRNFGEHLHLGAQAGGGRRRFVRRLGDIEPLGRRRLAQGDDPTAFGGEDMLKAIPLPGAVLAIDPDQAALTDAFLDPGEDGVSAVRVERRKGLVDNDHVGTFQEAAGES